MMQRSDAGQCHSSQAHVTVTSPSEAAGSGHAGSAQTAACSHLAPQFWEHSTVKEHTSNASTPRLRLSAQVPFGSVETLCEQVTLGHSEGNLVLVSLQVAWLGCKHCCRGALGCRQHALGAGSSRAQHSCLQNLISSRGQLAPSAIPVFKMCSVASLAECLGATGKVPVCLWLRKTVSPCFPKWEPAAPGQLS